MSGHIRTASGLKVHPLDPHPDEIDLRDIAHALSNVCRYTGHTRKFYSVAQHSVLTSWQVPAELRLQALMHDAPEAYIADIARPIKVLATFDLYRQAEERLMQCIADKFGFAWPEAAETKLADKRMLATEARDLMQWGPEDFVPWPKPYSFRVRPWKPKRARAIFLSEACDLLGGGYRY